MRGLCPEVCRVLPGFVVSLSLCCFNLGPFVPSRGVLGGGVRFKARGEGVRGLQCRGERWSGEWGEG